jgi:hypothetical protein
MGPLAVNLLLAANEKENNIIKAYMWAILAAEYLPLQKGTTTRYVIKSYLKPGQLEIANELINEYKTRWKNKEDCH